MITGSFAGLCALDGENPVFILECLVPGRTSRYWLNETVELKSRNKNKACLTFIFSFEHFIFVSVCMFVCVCMCVHDSPEKWREFPYRDFKCLTTHLTMTEQLALY